ncbi:MAG TPA: hypothetical protein VF263_21115 [Longimicrobiaceae bacterium]
MKRGRRKERPALPPAPLTFAYPLGVSGSAVAGAQVLAELPGEHAGHVFVALRAVLAWAHGPGASGGLLRERRAEPWLDALVRDAHALVLRDPDPERMPLLPSLAVLLADMSAPERADAGEVSRHCLNLSEWALTQEDATGTVLAFAEAAALASPWSGRLAWVVGKLYRSYGRVRDAEYWLKRASRLAVWAKDWEAHSLSLNSLGNLHLDIGAYNRAKALYARALRIAQRHRLRPLEGEILHDMFIAAFVTAEGKGAERYAWKAYEIYGAKHHRLPALAYDVACFWINEGYFARAFNVLSILQSHFAPPSKQLQVLSAATRAAGACGRRDVFHLLWKDGWSLIDRLEDRSTLAASLANFGLGAASIAEWDLATEALHRAAEVAEERQESDVKLRVRDALEAVQRHRSAERQYRRPLHTYLQETGGTFAERLVNSLRLGTQAPEM